MNYFYKNLRCKLAELIWRFKPSIMFNRITQPVSGLPATIHDTESFTIGILGDLMGLHSSYVQAAISLGIPYKVINIMDSDWIISVEKSQCKLFFAWPNPYHSSWKTMFDERILVMERDLGLHVYPRFDEIWPWESKRRMSYWLDAHNVSAPKTWIFYKYEEALSFANSASLPLVFKPDFGDCARGVEIVRSRRRAVALIKKAFRVGFNVAGHHPNDRVWGCVIFQEFIQNAREWRVIKIGDSLLCQLKGKVGDFHSGTRLVEYETPSINILDFTIKICTKGQFDSMSIDILEDENGQFYALEIQTVFGVDPWDFYMAIDGIPGRYRLEKEVDGYNYVFEKGVFCENACCNLRIRDGILKYYGKDIGFWEKDGDLERCSELARTKFRNLIVKGF